MKKRLPIERQTRLNYAGVTFLASITFFLIWVLLIGIIDSIYSGELKFSMSILNGLLGSMIMIIPFSIVAALSALLCWPHKTKRTKTRMALAGLLTVFSVFVCVATLIVLVSSYSGQGRGLIDVLKIWLTVIFASSLFTFGIPYVMGAWLSQLFVEEIASAD